jgi:hypothetical protein
MSIQAATKPLNDFTRMVNPYNPAYREVEGSWVKDADFYGCFEYIQIYYNPSKFMHSHQTVTVWESDLENNSSENLEVTNFYHIFSHFFMGEYFFSFLSKKRFWYATN